MEAQLDRRPDQRRLMARAVRLAVLALLCVALLLADLTGGRLGTRPALAGSGGGHYHSLAVPTRVLDTRVAQGHGGPIAANASFDLPIRPEGVNPADLQAVALEVTITEATNTGYLTVWPAGTQQPLASNLNWAADQQVSNLVIVGVGSGQAVSVFVQHSQTQVIADLYGYFSLASETGFEFRPVTSARILDTRSGLGGPARRLAGEEHLSLQVAGRGNVPASGVSAVVLQLTAAGPSAASYLTAYPHGGSPHGTSSINFPTGRDVGGRVIVGLNQGQIDIYQSRGDSDVIADVNGYFTDGSVAAAGGLFQSLQPSRVLDSRVGLGHAGPWAARQKAAVDVTTRPPVPVPAAAVVLNLTSTDASTGTFVTAGPDGQARSLSSDINVSPGPPVANLAVVRTSPAGHLALYNSDGQDNLVADVVGYFTAAPVAGSLPSAPQSLAASSGDRSAHLTWSPPSDSGGSQIVSWAVELSTGDEVAVLADPAATTVTGLVNTVPYNFSVVALNAAGSGPVSNQASATPLGTADPPTNVGWAPGSGSVSLSWAPPANNGGFPIDHYRITILPGGQLIGFTGTALTISSLDPGTVYMFTIQTVNSYGVGPAVGAGPVRPLGLRRVVISLSQQNLVAYQGGQPVLSTLVTTGRPELPTPPGTYHVFYKATPFHFISPWGPGSPFWYQDAWVDWAAEFINGGYFLHDAPWRGWYGPGSQYGDGTHGCVNVPHEAMRWLFGWIQIGDEVDVVG